MLQLFKIYGKISNEEEAEGVLKVSSFILIIAFTIFSIFAAIDTKEIPHMGLLCIILSVFTLKKRSKISAIILLIIMMLITLGMIILKSNFHSIIIFVFLLFQTYKSTEGVYKLKKYQKEYV